MAESDPTLDVSVDVPIDQTEPEMVDDRLDPKSIKMWKSRIARCKRVRTDLVVAWAENVNYRRGKPFAVDSDEMRVNVNLDWSLTKGKHAQLYSQTPKVYLTAKEQHFKAAVPSFAKQLNETLTTAKVGTAMDESVLDVINASGIGVVLCGYQATKGPVEQRPDRDITGMDPEQAKMMMQSGEIKLVPYEPVINEKYYIKRLSPSDLLWQTEFTRSDFDESDWVGYSGTMYWPEAVRELKVTEDDKDRIIGVQNRQTNLRNDNGEQEAQDEAVVRFDEIYYWAHKFDANEKYFKRINRMVFVHGMDKPVINEPWKGQKFDEKSGKYVGACKFPIRLLTLTYISDDAIPPSDTSIGRPQIKEMIQSRTDIVEQRRFSRPIRWGNTNLLDPQIMDLMMRGQNQAIIPTQGDGNKAIGEVARANYPTEDFSFDKVIKGDLNEQWQVSANQVGSYESGSSSATEASIVQKNFQTRIGYERARVSAFFVGIAEVIGGLLALYGNFPNLDVQEIQKIDSSWDRSQINNEFVYWIRPDSTVLLDSEQRVKQLERLLNLTGKSGFVNPAPLIEELVGLHGVDPEDVKNEPKDPPPDKPKISYNFRGEDMANPIVLATMVEAGQAPSPQSLQAALKMMEEAQKSRNPLTGMVTAAPDQQPQPGMSSMSSMSGMPGQPPNGMPPPGGPQAPPAPPNPAPDQHPNWGLMDRVSRRVEDI